MVPALKASLWNLANMDKQIKANNVITLFAYKYAYIK